MSYTRFMRSADLGDLLNLAFTNDGQADFLSNFPVWNPALSDSSKNTAHLTVMEGSRLVAHVGVRESKLKAPFSELPVGLVGAVATDPAFQGKGHASKLMRQALDWMINRKIPLVLLWGSHHKFYEKFGFELCGEQKVIPLSSLELPSIPVTGTRIYEGFTEPVFAKMKTRKGGLVLSDRDYLLIQSTQGVHWWRLMDPKSNQKVRAYAAMNRGIDLGGFVHEWGGDKESLSQVLAWIYRLHPDANILAPAFGGLEIPFQKESQNLGVSECLCLANVIDPIVVMRAFLGRNSSKPLPPIARNQWARELFGPWNLPFSEKLELSQPVPLWIWGLDGC